MKIVDFYFDLSSPYSYLAATQVPALAARRGAEVRWKPFVLAVNGPAGVPEGLGEGLRIPFRERLALDAKLASELAAMPPEDRAEMMREFGLEEPASDRLVHAVYRAVGLRKLSR